MDLAEPVFLGSPPPPPCFSREGVRYFFALKYVTSRLDPHPWHCYASAEAIRMKTYLLNWKPL